MIRKRVNRLFKAFMLVALVSVGVHSASAAGGAVAVATVNVQNASIVAQRGASITVGFDLTNREGAQPSIKYAIALAKQASGGNAIVDRKVYDDVVSLGINDAKHITAIYNAPDYLAGDYLVMVEARNAEGMPLGLSPAGKVSLKDSGSGVSILPETCYLTVGTSTKKYTLSQGVDVLPSEDLIAHCDVRNGLKNGIQATPIFVNHERSPFGEVVSSIKLGVVTLPGSKTTSSVLAVPLVSNPQAYDAVMTLLNSEDKPISNSVAFHYVIHGPSATIQNVVFDKDIYSKGDVAKLSFFWSGAADSFPGSRLGKTDPGQLVVSASISSGKGISCSDPYSAALEKTKPTITIPFSIKSDCENPVAFIEIKDQSGKVLAKNIFAVTSKPVSNKAWSMLYIWATSIFVILLCAALLAYRIMKKKVSVGSPVALPILFLLAVAGLAMFAPSAKADTFQGDIVDPNDPSEYITVTYAANIDKSLYNPGEDVIASGSFLSAICSNGSSFTSGDLRAVMTATVNGQTKTLLDSSDSGTQTFTAESAGGNYFAKFDAVSSFMYFTTSTVSYSIPYAVGGYDAKYIQDTIPDSFSPGQSVHVSVTFKNTGNPPWTTGITGPADPNTKAGTCDVDTDGDGVADAPAQTDANDNVSCVLNYAFTSSVFGLGRNSGGLIQSVSPVPVFKAAAPVTRTWHKGNSNAQVCTRQRICEYLMNDKTPFISRAYASLPKDADAPVCHYELDCTPAPTPGYYTTSAAAVDVLPGESVTFSFDLTAPMAEGAYSESWRMARGAYSFGDTFKKKITVGVPKGPALSVSPASDSAQVGQTKSYKASYTDNNGVVSDVTNDPGTVWTSSNPAIAKSNGGGVFEGIVPGNITVQAAYNSISASAGFSVNNGSVNILEIQPLSQSVDVGSSVSFKAIYTDGMGAKNDVSSDPGTVWSSSNESNAKSNGGGSFSGVVIGNVSVRAQYNGLNAGGNLDVVAGGGGGCGNSCPACTLAVLPGTLAAKQGDWVDFQVTLLGQNGYNSSTPITFNPSTGITMGPSTPSMMNPGQTANVKALVGNIQSVSPSVTVTAVCGNGGVGLTPSGSIILNVASSSNGIIEINPHSNK